jgi:hypothetical protein
MPDELRKKMIVCTPFGEYVNGEDEGEMTPERLRAIAANFSAFRRQVPIFMLGEHQFDLDERLPDGWVEGLEFSDGALVADVKLHGEAARYVADDRIRGASIGTVHGKNPDGSSQGEVLQHLLLTNNPFDKSLNIAAARKGGEPIACYFTALGGPDMDPKKLEELTKLKEENTKAREELSSLKDELAALKNRKPDERIEAMETALKDSQKENEELRAQNTNLLADMEKFDTNPKLEEALVQLKEQGRHIRAEKIRRLVGKGVSEGRFTLAHVGEPSKGWENDSNEAVLAWFKTSIFADSVDRLEFALATFDAKRHGQKHRSGKPPEGDGPITLTAEDRERIRKLGQDPDVVLAGMKAGDFGHFKELTSKD